MMSGNCLIILLFMFWSCVFVESLHQKIIWNAPFKQCKDDFNISLHIHKYNISVNPNRDGLIGSEISLLYANLGLYPHIDDNGTLINGGLPQLGNLTAHLVKAKRDIESDIPDPHFSGSGVMDYEAWRPIWGRNYDSKAPYQKLSEEIVKKAHPEWSKEKVQAEAKRQFEEAGRVFLTETLRLAEKLRPKGQWGYYGFPRCYNYDGSPECSKTTMSDNDQLHWLFTNSTAIYPSAYPAATLDLKQQRNFVYGQIHEAFRLHGNKPVQLYTRFRYDDTLEFMSLGSLQANIQQAWELGVEAIILWDDHHITESKTKCQQLRDYIQTTLGPLCQKLVNGPAGERPWVQLFDSKSTADKNGDNSINDSARKQAWVQLLEDGMSTEDNNGDKSMNAVINMVNGPLRKRPWVQLFAADKKADHSKNAVVNGPAHKQPWVRLFDSKSTEDKNTGKTLNTVVNVENGSAPKRSWVKFFDSKSTADKNAETSVNAANGSPHKRSWVQFVDSTADKTADNSKKAVFDRL